MEFGISWGNLINVMFISAGVGLRTVTFIEFLVTGFMIYMISLMILFVADPGKTSKTVGIYAGTI
ncbi:MAG: hypothetical protein K6E28_07295 [Eubacterium sp.]|nr:hypothetical protein [Eubacterium sp.]